MGTTPVYPCSICGLTLPVDRFYPRKDPASKSGISSGCKSCRQMRVRTRYANDPIFRERQRAEGRRYSREGWKWVRYGLTRERYMQLSADGCAACGATENLCIDHDHSCCPAGRSCGQCVRGALCKPCNTAAGYLRDDPDRMMALAIYALTFTNVLAGRGD
jgi:hypothetical protein